MFIRLLSHRFTPLSTHNRVIQIHRTFNFRTQITFSRLLSTDGHNSNATAPKNFKPRNKHLIEKFEDSMSKTDIFVSKLITTDLTKAVSMIQSMTKKNTPIHPFVYAKLVRETHYKYPAKFFDVAVTCINQMQAMNINPSIFFFNAVLTCCVANTDIKAFMYFVSHMKKIKLQQDYYTYKLYLQLLRKLGKTELMLQVLEEMKYFNINCDGEVYAELLYGYGEKGDYIMMEKVISLMEANNLQIPAEAAAYLINIHAKQNSLDLMEKTYERFAEPASLEKVTALVSGYKKLGYIDKMKETYQKNKNLIRADCKLYTALITGFAQHGLYEDVDALFQEMQSHGVTPDIKLYLDLVNVLFEIKRIDLAEPYVDLLLSPNLIKKLQKEQVHAIISCYIRLARVKAAIKILLRYKAGGDIEIASDSLKFLVFSVVKSENIRIEIREWFKPLTKNTTYKRAETEDTIWKSLEDFVNNE